LSRAKSLATWLLSAWMVTTGGLVSIGRAGATPNAAAPANESSAAPARHSSLPLRPRLFVANTDGNAVTSYPLGKFGNTRSLVTVPNLNGPSGIARDAAGRIYVANSTSDAITIYALGSHGTPNPIATIAGAKTGLKSPAGIALDSKGRIFVANTKGGTSGQGSVTIYPPLATGDIRPIAIVGGAHTGLNDPVDIALDSRGNIYVVNQVGLTGPGAVTIYRAKSNGDAAPIKSFPAGEQRALLPSGITVTANHHIYVTNQSMEGGGGDVQVFSVGPRWQISQAGVIEGSCSGMDSPQGIAIDASGDIYVANSGAAPESPAAAVTMYTAGSRGCADPVALICAGPAGLTQPAGLMLDSRRNIYVTDSNSNSVLVFAPLKPQLAMPTPTASPASSADSGGGVGFDATSTFSATLHAGIDTPLQLCQPPTQTTGKITLIKSIVSPATGMDHPSGIAFDKSGKLYVANPGSKYRDYDSITIYAPGTNPNAVPIATIGSFGATDKTTLGGPVALAVDATGEIFVANSQGDGIVIYAPDSNGNVPPMRMIAGSSTKLDSPVALAIDSSGDLYVLNATGGPHNRGSVTIYPPGGGGNVAPVRSISGTANADQTGLTNAGGLAVDGRNNIYVANDGSIGVGFDSVTIYPAGSNGNVAPTATISGPLTQLQQPSSVAVDSIGNIFVANDVSADGKHLDSITVYPPGSNGNVAPAMRLTNGTLIKNAVIQGSLTGLDQPAALAIGPGS
jgi:sugar lactone lactonase YvrE